MCVRKATAGVWPVRNRFATNSFRTSAEQCYALDLLGWLCLLACCVFREAACHDAPLIK